MVERNMSNAVMRGIVSSCRGRGPHHVHKDRVGTWDILRLIRTKMRLVRIGKVRSRSR